MPGTLARPHKTLIQQQQHTHQHQHPPARPKKTPSASTSTCTSASTPSKPQSSTSTRATRTPQANEKRRSSTSTSTSTGKTKRQSRATPFRSKSPYSLQLSGGKNMCVYIYIHTIYVFNIADLGAAPGTCRVEPSSLPSHSFEAAFATQMGQGSSDTGVSDLCMGPCQMSYNGF